jgi:hypothetical protein
VIKCLLAHHWHKNYQLVASREVPQQPPKLLNAVRSALQEQKAHDRCGNGRYTPCEAMVKPKKAKKKG